jgi:hypothetical protein
VCRALVNQLMNLRVPKNAGKLWSGYTFGGLSNSAQFHRVRYLSLPTTAPLPARYTIALRIFSVWSRLLYCTIPHKSVNYMKCQLNSEANAREMERCKRGNHGASLV